MFSVTISRSLARSFAHSFVWRMFVSSHWKEGRKKGRDEREAEKDDTTRGATFLSEVSGVRPSVRPSVSTLSTSSTSRQYVTRSQRESTLRYPHYRCTFTIFHFFNINPRTEIKCQVSTTIVASCHMPVASCHFHLTRRRAAGSRCVSFIKLVAGMQEWSLLLYVDAC